MTTKADKEAAAAAQAKADAKEQAKADAAVEQEAVDDKLKEIRPPAGDIPQEALDVMPDKVYEDKLDNPEVIESGLDVEGRKAPLPTLPENHAASAAAAVAAAETGNQTQDEVNHARKLARLEAEGDNG